MGMRIASSCWYITRWIRKQNETKKKDAEPCAGLMAAVPSAPVLSVLVACFAITMSSYVNVKNIFVHLGVGAVSFFAFLATVVLFERKLLAGLKSLWKGEI